LCVRRYKDADGDVSNARVAAAAEAFVRRMIDDLLATLPRPSAHTPPPGSGPRPPGTRRRRPPAKDRRRSEEKKGEGKESEEDEKDSSEESNLALKQRDSLIMSQMRLNRARVSMHLT